MLETVAEEEEDHRGEEVVRVKINKKLKSQYGMAFIKLTLTLEMIQSIVQKVICKTFFAQFHVLDNSDKLFRHVLLIK